MSKKRALNNEAVIYQAKSGAIELRGDLEKETVWATQAQIADVFSAERSVITKHIRNIFSDKELDLDSVCAKFAHTAEDGKLYETNFYNLDVILAVGYRVNSTRAIQFRQWATNTLRQHITKGYIINPKIIKRNYAEFQKALTGIKHLLPASTAIDNQSVVELISAFAQTWLSLDAYDKNQLTTKGVTKKSVKLTAEQIAKALLEFKTALIKSGQATELFGSERSRGNIDGIVGNVMQTFGGKDVYPSLEEKAANLLYFMIKNHPFVDGNKRSGAYAFVWFLNRAGILDRSKMTSVALTALTLFIAESNPKNKDLMVSLIIQLLNK